MDLVWGQQIDGCQQMDVVVPNIEAGEVRVGRRLVSEEAGIGRMGFDGPEVRLDARIVIGGARPAEQLPNAKLGEVLASRVRAHLGTAVAEGGRPLRARLVQQALIEQAVIPEGLPVVTGESVADEPGHDLAAEVVDQTVQVEKDMRLGRGQPGDIAVPELIGAGDPVRVRDAQGPGVDLSAARTVALQRDLIAPDTDGRHRNRRDSMGQTGRQLATTLVGMLRRADHADHRRGFGPGQGIDRAGPRSARGQVGLRRTLPALERARREAEHRTSPLDAQPLGSRSRHPGLDHLLRLGRDRCAGGEVGQITRSFFSSRV